MSLKQSKSSVRCESSCVYRVGRRRPLTFWCLSQHKLCSAAVPRKIPIAQRLKTTEGDFLLLSTSPRGGLGDSAVSHPHSGTQAGRSSITMSLVAETGTSEVANRTPALEASARVGHSTSAHILSPQRFTWPPLSSRGQGNAVLLRAWWTKKWSVSSHRDPLRALCCACLSSQKALSQEGWEGAAPI